MRDAMKDDWGADVQVEAHPSGGFSAVLVLTPPLEIGPPIHLPIDGTYERAELAEMAALDAFAAMTRGG